MANEITIPILPCKSIEETLTFYVALGFEITYQQARPNTYACVKRDDFQLHFFSMKGYDPAQSYSTCYVHVPDADALYKTFALGLRKAYGKLPVAGIPRMTPLRNKSFGTRGFNMIDPGGNWIRIGQTIQATEDDQADTTKLIKVLRAANTLADSKGDFEAAAKILDAALAQDEPTPAVHRVQALILRAEIAISMDDQLLAGRLLGEARQIPLHDEDRTVLAEDLQRADDLEQALR